MTVELAHERINSLKSTSESARYRAAVWLGCAAANGVTAAAGIADRHPLFAASTAAVSILSAALTAYESQEAVATSREATAMSGALMSHELAIAAVPQEVPFDQDV